jgi:hypothetical protein
MIKAQHILLLMILLYVIPAPAQNIGGVVNTYYHVIEVIPSKACVRVSNSIGLNTYDNALLIQMKGATVSTLNDNSFGSIISLNNAGNYELAYICSVRGDSVFFLHELNNTYTETGKLQLVRVPEYASATVTSPLTAAPWDNTTGTGGVLAIVVSNTLTLNNNINADTLGFKGGASKILNGTCGSLLQFSNYSYNTAAGSTGGGYKGEGIVDLAANQNGGRGPAANGGGGGNDHNNGAGGGGNLSAGGDGGNNNSTIGCNNKYVGVAGVALSNGGNKIYLGGGGGNGHGNNTLTAYGGGAGGGIVFIKAGAIAGNNYTVSARGYVGATTFGDGGSGGGAGGTIIMDVNNYVGNTNVIADGGNGGGVDNVALASRSMGPGGGGAGGAIYFTGAIPAVTISDTGGTPGLSYNLQVPNPPVNNGAAGGATGSIVANYTVSRSVVPAAYCSNLLLPLSLLYFDGFRQDDHALLSWRITSADLIRSFTIEYAADGITWHTLRDVTVTGNDDILFRQSVPLLFQPYNYYRLKITGANNQIIYSKIVLIKNTTAGGYVGVYPNPAKQKIALHASLNGQQSFRLFGIDGKLVFKTVITFYNNAATVQLPVLQRSLYVLEAGGIKSRLLIE